MRMGEGRETFNRLLNWDRGQAPSERLAAIILSKEGFKGVDPSHPLGGKDGLKDMVLSFNGKRWIGAVYFPRGQQSFSDIKSKFIHDLSGIDANNANGLAFVTNQEIRLSERKILTEIAPKIDVQIYHLERIASLLNTPSCYGIRMEFLDIEMSKEEQLSFFADNEQRLSRIESTLDQVAISLAGYKVISEPGALKPQSDIADDTLDNGDYEIAPRSMEEVADWIHGAGGLSVLAHPGANLKGREKELEELLALELDGIEVFSSYHSEAQEKYFLETAERLGKLVTCGSDFHGKTKPAVFLGEAAAHSGGQAGEITVHALKEGGIL